MRTGVNYNFRVKAKNAAGWSPASRDDINIVLKPDCVKPSAPGIPEIKKVHSKSVELKWTPPENDGGSKITGYIIEKRQAGTEFWIRAYPHQIVSNELEVNDLVENSEYEFRVKAVNKAGESDPSVATEKIKVTEYPDGRRPEFTVLPVKTQGSIGGGVEFKAEFEGHPNPEVKWYKNGFEITPSGSRFQINTNKTSSSLTINQLSDFDDNQSVKCVLVNPLGKETSEVLIKIIGKFMRFFLFIKII